MRQLCVRPWMMGLWVALGACKTLAPPEETSEEEPKPEPTATKPATPTALGATDFCKLIYEAPKRSLDKTCTAADAASARYRSLSKTVAERVQTCWTMLNAGVQNKRVTLPRASAQRCATALEKLSWQVAFDADISEVAECRNIAIGLAGAGKPCRATYECGPALFCSDADAAKDGLCKKRLTAGESCVHPAWTLLGEATAACDAGLFCDVDGRDDFLPPSVKLPSKKRKKKKRRRRPRTYGGKLEAWKIRKVVRTQQPRFKICHEVALMRDPTLSGRIDIDFTIATDGSVSFVTAKEGGIDDEGFKRCVEVVFDPLMFPAPTGGRVSVSYPLVFHVSDGKHVDPEPGPSNTCQALKKEGDGCARDGECEPGQVCHAKKCAKPLPAGSECQRDGSCAAGLRCLGKLEAPEAEEAPKRFCEKPRATGAACGTDRDCSGLCSESKCAAFCGH